MSKLPGVAVIELEDLAEDPYPELQRLRMESPVAQAQSAAGVMWLVTRRDDVLSLLRDPGTFSTDNPASPIRDTFGAQMLSTEGDAQKRYKSACAPPFNRRAVDQDATPIVSRRAAALLDDIARTTPNEPVDLRATLAAPLALSVVADVIGIPEDMHDRIRVWYDGFAAALATHDPASAARREGRNSAAAFREAVRPLLGKREQHPDLSLLSHLVRQPQATRLRDEEIVANTLIVLFGGIETTEAAILNALWALLLHDDARAAALSDEGALDLAIEESLRWEPAVQTCTRYTTRPTTLRGVPFAAGDIVQCMIGSANRDPEYFPRADVFDIARRNASEHLSFGSGRHYCLGAALARVEARVAIESLLTRWPETRLDGRRDSRPFGHEFRKPPALWVTR